MRKNLLILGIVAIATLLLLVGISAKLYLHRLAVRKHAGPPHVFELSQRPEFLTEELALVKAREALRLDGDNPAIWQPVRDPQSYLTTRGYRLASVFSPSQEQNGHTLQYLSFELKRPNCGIIIFVHEAEGVRFVRVGLSGSSVLCQCSAGK